MTVLMGRQTPLTLVTPPITYSRGQEVVEFAASLGMDLDPWQQDVLHWALAHDGSGKWSSYEVGLVVPRQNGKTEVLVAAVLAYLVLFGDKLILYSAHEYRTARETWLRMSAIVENSSLSTKIKRINKTHGEEGVEFIGGNRVQFLARSRGSGRGFSGDKVIWDEAYNLPDFAVEATLPTLSARPNPQVWYTSMAPDKDLAPCEPLGRLRERALSGTAKRVVFAEWAIEPHDDHCGNDCVVHDEPSNPRAWAKANPGLGRRLDVDLIEVEMEAMSPDGFARERLGVGNWPTSSTGWGVIDEKIWTSLVSDQAAPVDPVVFAADVTPERSYGAIAAADAVTVEIVDHDRGTHWMVQRILELDAKWGPTVWVIDPSGPAGSLIPPLESNGVTVVKTSARQMTAACGLFFERSVDAKTLRHRGQPELTAALAGAKKRPLGSAWAWSRISPSIDITPLVASTLALWGHQTHGHLIEQQRAPKQYFFDPDKVA